MKANLSADIERQIESGAAILKRGGVIAYPTDTVYGLGAAFNMTEAIRRVYEIKERPLSMPLPLLLASDSQLEEITRTITPLARLLMDKFWPGSLTLVMPAAESVPDIITAGGKTVAVRIPDHPVPLALINKLGVPIIGTSANLSGKPSPLTAEEVSAQLGGRMDFLIDGGHCPGGKESTIIDVSGAEPVLIREGAIPRAEIEKVCKIRLKEGK